jgi:Nuclease-related domain/AAA domain
MAILYPDLKTIMDSKVSPTEGELKLVKFLYQNLDDSYEIFFQPFLNGDNPDLILMRRGSGVIIFEVKDWKLEYYTVKENNIWILTKDGTQIKSPLDQVNEYKNNLINLHIDTLLEKKIRNKNHLSIIKCALFFSKETEKDICAFNSKQNCNYQGIDSYFSLLGSDSLNENRLSEIISGSGLNQPSELFTDDLYESFKRYLKPPFHRLEEGKHINYTNNQKKLIVSTKNAKQKIKGVAGSGKTLVLAKRAVNAHKRTNSKILILTFNLTLKNYIHDRISDVREDFFWNNFYITNYHQFFKSQANNHNLPILNINAWQNTIFFDKVAPYIERFDAILIDEVQDYMTEWLEIITKYFLASDGEFVVFGDEKQNIYNRPLDEEKVPIIRTIPGRWNKSMNESMRSTNEIINLANEFQKYFFADKYSIDDIKASQRELNFETKVVEYYYIEDKWMEENISKILLEIIKKHQIHPSDVCILNSKIEYIRNLDYYTRQISKEKTKTTFETFEIYKHFTEQKLDKKSLRKKLEDIRKNKKNHFWMNTGIMKISTVHSFKGWEIHSLFLLIESEIDEDDFVTGELIYTGMTRARVNLFVINLGNKKYDIFFNAYKASKSESIECFQIKD